MRVDRAGLWTFSRYDAGGFGFGMVVCCGEAAARIWLPAREGNRAWPELSFESYQQRIGAEMVLGGSAEQVARRLAAVFERGENVTDLPIVWPESGPFIESVWRECLRIPRGEVLSYMELGQRAGNVKATRAVGNAMAQNPLPLVIPCHRVVTADGRLGNYGGGVEMKRWLLEREGVRWPRGRENRGRGPGKADVDAEVGNELFLWQQAGEGREAPPPGGR